MRSVGAMSSFDSFLGNEWIPTARALYDQRALLAARASEQIGSALEEMNSEYVQEHQRVLFTTIEYRVKSWERYISKVYSICQVLAARQSFSKEALLSACDAVKDLCGARFCVPYSDEVLPAINQAVRPRLRGLGFGTELADVGLQDKDMLDKGDEWGYRSYHFYVIVPAVVDIYGATASCLCEVQARTELQHVWAVKSHDLFYAPQSGFAPSPALREDMSKIGDHLSLADYALTRIKNAVRDQAPGVPRAGGRDV